MAGIPPRIRIVHPGGPGVMAQVWLGDRQLTNVTRVEISPLDADDNRPVTVKLTLLDPEFAVEGDLTLDDIVEMSD